jgi:hypothetical protein
MANVYFSNYCLINFYLCVLYICAIPLICVDDAAAGRLQAIWHGLGRWHYPALETQHRKTRHGKGQAGAEL